MSQVTPTDKEQKGAGTRENVPAKSIAEENTQEESTRSSPTVPETVTTTTTTTTTVTQTSISKPVQGGTKSEGDRPGTDELGHNLNSTFRSPNASSTTQENGAQTGPYTQAGIVTKTTTTTVTQTSSSKPVQGGTKSEGDRPGSNGLGRFNSNSRSRGSN